MQTRIATAELKAGRRFGYTTDYVVMSDVLYCSLFICAMYYVCILTCTLSTPYNSKHSLTPTRFTQRRGCNAIFHLKGVQYDTT